MKENKRESLAEKAENLRTAALNLYEDVRKKENDIEVLGKEWMELARGRAEKLKNFRYNIGVVGVQSSGKTTLLNTLLGYPLMPSAAVVTTCSVTYIRYGEKLAVKAEDAYGKIYNMHLEKMSRALFEDLKRYTCKCHKKYSLDHLIYFTDADMSPDEEGNPCTLAAEELSLEYGNLMHRAVLVLVLLSLYVDQNQNPELLDDTIKEIIGERKLLLEKIGIPRSVKEYKVILEWNNPVLKNGLEITDLPGLGADVAASSGYKSHESITLEELNKTDSTLLILEPEMKKEHIDPLNPILTSYEMKKIKNLEERLIPVVNKIDLCGFKNAYMNKLNQVYKKYQLEIEKTYGIAALLAEQRLFEKNPEIPLSRSAFARRNLEGVKELLEMTGASQEEYIKKMLDKNMGYSRFEEFAAYILDYLPKAEIMEALQLLIYLYQAVKTAVMMRNSRFRILSQFHRGGASAGVELVKKLDNDTKAEIAKLSATQAKLMKEWRDALEIRMYKTLLPEVQKTFEEDICKEFGTMKDRIMEKRKALHANFIGDIVLSRNNGANPDTRNYPVWTGMLDTLEKEKYQKTFDSLSDRVKGIFGDMVKRMDAIDQAFTGGFTASAEEFINFCKERQVKYYKEALQGILDASARGELSDSQNRRIAGKTAKYLRENEPKVDTPKINVPK
ncbi:MAG TPA: dynamin family protein, partial [Candidatus Blautia pullistercoris]|nr:dynamin family protein [Candidatus Blautia pullistercoris]